jgi:hypothetical protein
MDNKLKRKIDWAFYNYNTLIADTQAALDDIRNSGLIADMTKVGHSCGIGRPTEQKAIKCMVDEKALWCAVVERTYIQYKWTMEGVILKKKYFDKKSRAQIMCECEVSESSYHFWLGRIRATAELWAYEFGLI